MKTRYIVFIAIAIITLLLIMAPKTQAAIEAVDTDGGDYVTGYSNEMLNWTFDTPAVPYKLSKIVGFVIAGLRNLSIVVTVVVLTILGFKYMVGSVEQKADYKKDFPNIIIGVTVISGVFSIVSVIFSLI